MRFIKFTALASMSLAFLLAFGAFSDTFAQGRGGGGGGRPTGAGGGGRPSGVGRPMDMGRPSNPGIGTASERSGGRSNRGLENAAERSQGRSTEGLSRAERARQNRENGMRSESEMPSDRELNRYRGISRRLGVSPEELRSRYESYNGDLNFGQFVAAHMIANNLSTTNSNITSGAILSRVASGSSIGEALRDLGFSRDEARRAEKEAKRQLKASRDQ
jgi:hypothetical protein